jgi:valyl-tRNA synthetase
MKVGRRLAMKVLNASKFVLGGVGATELNAFEVSEPIDCALLARLATVVTAATEAFEAYDYARALERTEAFFWTFCDDYVELVKGRAYGAAGAEGAASANAALRVALSTLLRLLAPITPYVTEEAWSWWQEGSIHRAAWPEAAAVRAAAGDGDRLIAEVAGDVLGAVRKAKSEARKSMRAPVARVVVRDTGERLDALRFALDDVKEAGSIKHLDLELVGASGAGEIEVELADDPA